MINVLKGRKFQFWLYRVGHGELLVRSPKDAQNAYNVDIVFVDVEYVDLPRFLPELEIEEAKDDDALRAAERLGKPVDTAKVFILKCRGRRHIVVALALRIAESEMDIFESPFQ